MINIDELNAEELRDQIEKLDSRFLGWEAAEVTNYILGVLREYLDEKERFEEWRGLLNENINDVLGKHPQLRRLWGGKDSSLDALLLEHYPFIKTEVEKYFADMDSEMVCRRYFSFMVDQEGETHFNGYVPDELYEKFDNATGTLAESANDVFQERGDSDIIVGWDEDWGNYVYKGVWIWRYKNSRLESYITESRIYKKLAREATSGNMSGR